MATKPAARTITLVGRSRPGAPGTGAGNGLAVVGALDAVPTWVGAPAGAGLLVGVGANPADSAAAASRATTIKAASGPVPARASHGLEDARWSLWCK